MILLSDKSTVKVELTEPGESMEAQLFHPTNHHGILSYPGNAQSIISSALENKHVDINDQSFIDLIKKHGFNKSKAKRWSRSSICCCFYSIFVSLVFLMI